MTKRKICVVTGTRAEYGLLYWLMKAIQVEPESAFLRSTVFKDEANINHRNLYQV